MSIFEPDDSGSAHSGHRVPCPMCGEQILVAAKKCKYCGEWINDRRGLPGTGSAGEILRSREELHRIAVLQKAIIWAVIFNLVGYPLLGFLPKTGLVMGIAVEIFQLDCIAKLASALRSRFVWLWVIGALIPCVSFIVLLAINGNATSALQLVGVRVGLLGARLRDLEENA